MTPLPLIAVSTATSIVGWALAVADVSPGQTVGVVSGVAGSVFLGGVGLQIMRTYRASTRWGEVVNARQEATIARLEEEITRANARADRERERAHKMANQMSMIQLRMLELAHELTGRASSVTAAKLAQDLAITTREVLDED